jgi:nucleoside-diphosphate-sugar epimerase
MNKKVALVTGAAGFTGTYVCKALLERGYSVKALVRQSSQSEKMAALGVDIRAIEFLEGDLARPDTLKGKLAGVDTLFHVAALYRQEGVPKQMFFTVNTEGTKALLDEAIAAGVKRVVHCSTVGVQGEIADPPANEDAPYSPGDHYQESKMEGEKIALAYFREGRIEGVVVRPLGIYGPGDTRFLKLFRHIYKGRFRMIGSGRVLYHLTFVEDLAEGIILAGETPGVSGRVYAIGGDRYLPLSELVAMIAGIFGKPVSRLHIPLWPVYAAAYLCETLCRPLGLEPPLYRRRLDFFTKDRAFDISRARKDLGYSPRVNLKEGLTRTALWYKEQGWLK